MRRLITVLALLALPTTAHAQYLPSGAQQVQGTEAANRGYPVSVASAPNADTTYGIAPVATATAASSLIVKASSGNLYRLSITTAATPGFLMVFNVTTAPADGTVAPPICRAIAANSTLTIAFTDTPAAFSTGITAVFSSTGCFTKTASATAYIEGYAK